MRSLVAGLALIALLGAACSSPAAQPSGTAAPASPVATAAAGGEATCRPMDLVLPSGEPLDLTGSWTGDDLGPYQFRQFGDCLWFVGQNTVTSALFFGRLATDFTVHGRWSTVAASDHYIGEVNNRAAVFIGTGTMRLQIDASAGPNNTDVVLRKIDQTDDPDYTPSYTFDTTTWTRVDQDPDHPIPSAAP